MSSALPSVSWILSLERCKRVSRRGVRSKNGCAYEAVGGHRVANDGEK